MYWVTRLFGIEGVNRARQQQYAGETRTQRRHNRAARPFKAKQKRSARGYFSHVRSRTASDSMVLGQIELNPVAQ